MVKWFEGFLRYKRNFGQFLSVPIFLSILFYPFDPMKRVIFGVGWNVPKLGYWNFILFNIQCVRYNNNNSLIIRVKDLEGFGLWKYTFGQLQPFDQFVLALLYFFYPFMLRIYKSFGVISGNVLVRSGQVCSKQCLFRISKFSLNNWSVTWVYDYKKISKIKNKLI